MFKDQTIRKRVMAVVESRIAGAQKTFDEECSRMDTLLQEEIKKLHMQNDLETDRLADKLVNQVFGK